VDFFVSHAGQDQCWAEWLAWQLVQAGYDVELDVWDWAPGQDFVARMQVALSRAERVLAVWSLAYFRSVFGAAELRAGFVRQAHVEGRVVPVLVEPARVPELYASLIYVDLVGLDEADAVARLRARLTAGRPRTAPGFPARGPAPPPSGERPAFAGVVPGLWNVPARNPHFTGRAQMLSGLRQRLRVGEHTLVVQSLYGLGGVGKTQLAVEYAHRFAADYQLVWWIDAEQPVLLGTQLAQLAESLGLLADRPVGEAVRAVLDALRRRSDWLLILDNVQRPQDLAGYRPGGAGQVLITSRYPGWGGLGGRLEVDVLTRAETVTLLRRRLPDLADQLDDRLADELAAELGDLPLAVSQAAGYLESTGLRVADYLRRFRARRGSLLAHGEAGLYYRGRLDAAWTLSLDRLAAESPAAVALLQVAAFLAPEPIPLHLFTGHDRHDGGHVELLAEPLRAVAADPDALDDVIGQIVGYSLARRQGEQIRLHRLVQAAIRHQLSPAVRQREQDRALALLTAAHPGDPFDSATWPRYAELAPHMLTTAALADDRADSRRLLLDTARYLLEAGDLQACRTVATQLGDRWRQTPTLGPDHPDSLTAAATLTAALDYLGEAEAARALGQDTLERARRVLGSDHPSTVTAAAALTVALAWLGEAETARALGQDTLQRARRVLGSDHPSTVTAAAALTVALAWLGEAETARALGQDTLQRARRVFGPDHPTTLLEAVVLADVLVWLGEVEAARALGQDTLERSRRVFGPDHPLTLWAAVVLTDVLAVLGEGEAARALGQDTLQRAHLVFGPDHPLTLRAAVALTAALVGLGEGEAARALGQDTLQRIRRVLGPDHPTTLRVVAALAPGGSAPTTSSS
jgi:hypothetical protein